MSSVPRRRMTADEFLLWVMERPEGERYELVRGEVLAMAPEKNRHNLVKLETAIALRSSIRRAGLDCTVLGDGATVVIDKHSAYEPDVTVQCGALDLDATTADRPMVLVEVLSASTSRIDTGEKLEAYFGLPSVMHYLILNSDTQSVIHHARAEDDTIVTRIVSDGELSLKPPGFRVKVLDLFPQGP